jgi:hypothetical protein
MRYHIIFFLVLLIPVQVIAQPDSLKAKENVRFAHYLLGTNQYIDAIYLINQLDLSQKEYNPFLDSINFMKGWAFYSIKSLDSASLYFLRTTPNTSTGIKSRFFSAYNSIYQNNYENANQILGSMALPDSQLIELRCVQQAGIELLKRNYTNYNELKNNFTNKYYSLTEAEEKLNQYHLALSSHKKKSPLVAGIMSSIIPGSGKMYSGKIGEGVSALLSNAILAGITIENYRKAGPRDFKTIFFGSLFTIFYCGNIYGSMISVQVSNNEFNNIYDNKILFDIHIPLRTIFN